MIHALVFVCLVPVAVQAHDPLDCSSRVAVSRDSIQLTITMGLDGVRELLSEAGFSTKEIAGTVASRGPRFSTQLPLTVAPRLFELKGGGEDSTARSITGISDGMEVAFHVIYPRPAGDLELKAVYFDVVKRIRPGWLAASDQSGRRLLAVVLSRTNSIAHLALPSSRADQPPPALPSPPVVDSDTAREAVLRPGKDKTAAGTKRAVLPGLGLCGIAVGSIGVVIWRCKIPESANEL